jgi:hypothetical protein
MKHSSVITTAALVLLFAAPAFAEATDKEDVKAEIQIKRIGVEQDWPKKEEPALRPYKNIAHGIYSLLWHTVHGLADGNEKFPGFGSVEVFRGARRGSVELVNRTVMGAAFSKPRDHTYYSKPNRVIDSDPLLYHAADFASPAIIGTAVAGAETGVLFGAIVKRQQMITDTTPFVKEEKAAEVQTIFEPDRVSKAQERYVGKRAKINKKNDGTGNLLKLARQK